jgi:hypothetical protein
VCSNKVIYIGGGAMSDALEKLDNARWLVVLDDHMRKVYAQMREQEEAYLDSLKAAGATVLRFEKPGADDNEVSGRRALVLVPPAMKMPSPKKLVAHVAEWRDTLAAAAARQDLEPTVGVRGASLPVWLGPNGADVPFTEPRPAYAATVVTHHLQRAFRGARLEPDDALVTLRERVERTEAAIQHSIAHSKKDRIARQQEARDNLNGAITHLTALMSQGCIASVRIQSGLSWRINIKCEDGSSFASTIATIGLIPGAADATIKEARTRTTKDKDLETVLLPGGFLIYVTRPLEQDGSKEST